MGDQQPQHRYSNSHAGLRVGNPLVSDPPVSNPLASIPLVSDPLVSNLLVRIPLALIVNQLLESIAYFNWNRHGTLSLS